MLVAVFLAVALSSCDRNTPAVTEGGGEVGGGQGDKVVNTDSFATDLYARLAAQSKDNLFFSPTSIETALAMTYAGARGDTAAQMAKTLHYENDAAKVNASFAKLLRTLNNPREVVVARFDKSGKMETTKQPAYQLFVANALWGQQGYPFESDFINLVQKNYGGGLNNVDFKNCREEARKTINDWVATQTRDKIKNLIAPSALSSFSRLVLTNAIYFKSVWEDPFPKDLTKDGSFHLSSGKSVKVPLMHQTREGGYGENDTMQWLELPYAGNALSMVVLLPKNVDGLAAMEKNLTAENISQWLKTMSRELVEVTFPKFTFTSSCELGDHLAAMGMPDAFNPGKADFLGIAKPETTGEPPLFISRVIHKAFIAVNEEETEAAAATAVIMDAGAAPGWEPPKPKVFKADHPFIFLIRHNATGEILFLGRVVNPTSE